MGGTGNTGLTNGPLGLATPTAAGSATAPGWAAAVSDTPAAATPPPARPYELMTPSLGSLTAGSGGGVSSTVASPGPMAAANLGFPTGDVSEGGFNHTPFPTHAAPVTTYAGPAPAPAAPAAPAASDPNAPKPSDWLYPGNLPMNFSAQSGIEYGKPIPYSATGANYTPGYGAVGGFGGVAGYGPAQEGLADQKLLPKMEAGTQLKDAQIDQYNRVRREDYDRYMKLYGVGYDLPAYQQALNGLVGQYNLSGINAGGPGG